MGREKKPTISTLLEQEIFKKYYAGYEINDLSEEYNLETLDIIRIVTKITDNERAQKKKWRYKKDDSVLPLEKDYSHKVEKQSKKCKFCRWRPCTGAPSCYKEMIDYGQNI